MGKLFDKLRGLIANDKPECNQPECSVCQGECKDPKILVDVNTIPDYETSVKCNGTDYPGLKDIPLTGVVSHKIACDNFPDFIHFDPLAIVLSAPATKSASLYPKLIEALAQKYDTVIVNDCGTLITVYDALGAHQINLDQTEEELMKMYG